MRHYFNLDGARVVPQGNCDDGAAIFAGDSLGGARIFAESREENDDCGSDPTPDPSNPVGSANCYLGYYCANPQAYNYNVLYDVTPEEDRLPNVTPNSCSNSSLCEFIVEEEDGGIGVVTGANPYIGCTDPAALNYDINAEQDNGSCEYPPEPAEDPFDEEPDPQIQGCTNPAALNYDPSATIGSDDLCVFEEVEPIGLNTTTIFVAGGAAILLLLALRKR